MAASAPLAPVVGQDQPSPRDDSTGAEDARDRERIYDDWDRHHVPGYLDRNPQER